jgi:hypothetical protein
VCGLHTAGSGYGLVAGYQHGNELSCGFLTQSSDYQLLKKGSAPQAIISAPALITSLLNCSDVGSSTHGILTRNFIFIYIFILLFANRFLGHNVFNDAMYNINVWCRNEHDET